MSTFAKGLEGVVAGQTAICTVGRAGDDLAYRGYSIEDLCDKGASFEEVAYMLIYGERPNKDQLATWEKAIVKGRALPSELIAVIDAIPPTSHPMDVLRTGISFLGNLEPETEKNTQAIVPRLIGIGPSIIAHWYLGQQGKKAKLDYPHADLGGFFLYALRGGEMPTDMERDMMRTSMLLYAEHGFNASTFACRVTTGTLSDIYSAIVTAIGTLKGPLHGGANEKAMEMILRFKGPEDAEKGIKEMLAKKEKVMGFGHRVYKVQDPRNVYIKAWSKKLNDLHPELPYHAIAEVIDRVVSTEKKLFPNTDFYHAPAYYLLGIPIKLFTCCFVFARMSGWLAHALEQRADNRLIRPTEEYIGPEPRTWE